MLGVIGFPYQFIFAITGVVLIISSVLVVPFSKLFYEGDPNLPYKDLGYAYYMTPQYEFTGQPIQRDIDIDQLVRRTQAQWGEAFIQSIAIRNYGDENMHVALIAEPDFSAHFAGSGMIVYRIRDGAVVQNKSPLKEATYMDKMKSLVYRLHFGDYGGYPLIVVYFLLGLAGCLVIASGIMIWLVARDKPKIPPHKRKFNFWAANVFIAACLTLFPVTALAFIAVKVNAASDMGFIYRVYFYSWLALSPYYIAWRDLRKTNIETLFLGSLLGLFVPITNGIVTGNWIWNTYNTGAFDIMLVDVLWMGLALSGFLAWGKARAKKKSAIPNNK